MKKLPKWLLLGFLLVVAGCFMAASSSSTVFLLGLSVGSAGIVIIIAIWVNRASL